jgi:hypothetical protein
MGGTSMRPLLAVIILASMTAAAAAQDFTLSILPPSYALPQVRNLKNAAGETIGTGYITGNRMVIRDTDNRLIGTLVTDADGQKFFNPDGKLMPQPPQSQ